MSDMRKVYVRVIRLAEVADVEIEWDFAGYINGMDAHAEAAAEVRERVLRGDVALHPPRQALYVIPSGKPHEPGFLD